MSAGFDNSENSDSSLDSTEYLYLGTMEDFRIKRGKVRARDAREGNIRKVDVKRLSEIHGSGCSEWAERTEMRFRMRKTAKNWTTLFLSEGIVLQGHYECANLLRASSCISSNPIIVEADAFFPYCSEYDRRVNGYKVGQVQDARNVTVVHLSERTSRQLTLEAGEVYLIGGLYDPQPYCHVCRKSHDIEISPCAAALRFMPLPSHAHFKKQIYDRERPGARVLTLIPGKTTELSCYEADDELCRDCHDKAVRNGAMWLKMDGSCPDKRCPMFEWCECWDENEPDSGLCVHYVYVKECKYNNLPDEPLATAIATGLIKVVTGSIEPYLQRWTSGELRRVARKLFKQGKKVTLEELLEQYSMEFNGSTLRKSEVMALAMRDVKLADIIDGYNSYTLSKINGFVENTEMMEVGPWLTGRLVTDCDGVWWQTGRSEPVLVSTEGDVSTVWKASMASMRESDDLGWVELGNFRCIEHFLRLSTWSLPQIAVEKWIKSPPILSGVGATLSELIHSPGYRMYRTQLFYEAHIGVILSKMNAQFREKNADSAHYFANGGQVYRQHLTDAAAVTSSRASIAR